MCSARFASTLNQRVCSSAAVNLFEFGTACRCSSDPRKDELVLSEAVRAGLRNWRTVAIVAATPSSPQTARSETHDHRTMQLKRKGLTKSNAAGSCRRYRPDHPARRVLRPASRTAQAKQPPAASARCRAGCPVYSFSAFRPQEARQARLRVG